MPLTPALSHTGERVGEGDFSQVAITSISRIGADAQEGDRIRAHLQVAFWQFAWFDTGARHSGGSP